MRDSRELQAPTGWAGWQGLVHHTHVCGASTVRQAKPQASVGQKNLTDGRYKGSNYKHQLSGADKRAPGLIWH